MRDLAAYLIGLIFGLGIVISGMVNPAKVLNFFDVAGDWDPSLMFVMGGALAVTAIGYRLVFRRGRALWSESFDVPTNRSIDVRLIAGAVLFGIGWGISGFCPGGAVPALGTGLFSVMVFVVALVAGMALVTLVDRLLVARSAKSE
jgi:uncharacterized protein